MKKVFLSLLVLLSIATMAQEQNSQYLWPIQGEKAGTNIISAPQSYIDKELNFGNMIISAPEGTDVVSPVDGTIAHFSITYYNSLGNSNSYRTTSPTFNGGISEVTGSFKNDPKYLSGSISINCGNGVNLHILGLRGDVPFKTGQKIKKGDVIGTVGYCYHKITESSIMVSVSKNSKVADPMTPFGIKSTYIPYDEIKPVTSLTKEQAKEDFLVAINSLKEALPGLYDIVTEKELADYINSTTNEINAHEGDLAFPQFWSIMKGVVAKIHDSHVGLIAPSWYKGNPTKYRPQVWLGWINNILTCTNAIEEYKHLIGKQIVSVNGIKADDAKKIVAEKVSNYDAKATGYVDSQLAIMGFANLFRKDYGDYNYDMVLELADGQKVEVKSGINQKDAPGYVHNIGRFMNANRRRDKYEMKMLNESTAYIGLSSFALNQVQLETIGAFIDSISDVKHLIFDVRNNGGGHVESLNQLYSFIAQKPSEAKSYSFVNKKGGFDCFKYSLNYNGVEEDIFSGSQKADGKYYFESEGGDGIKPNSKINYKGKVYVLTNEYSVSAATLFPALVVRNGRGVTIGRETSTAYHFMNALKFVQVKLPNSTIVISIPLVKCVFDDVVNDRVPYGRGAMPDYYVPITLDEMTYKDGDAILNYTLKLIEKGEYFKNNPFVQMER